jgi:ATP-binding cassette subfamily E protein 1
LNEYGKTVADKPISALLEAADTSGRLNDLKEDMSLTEIWDRPIKFLSGGELQRVAMTAAIVREGDIYFFDEPTAYLDVRERLRVGRAIRNLSDQGKTVVVVEHDLSILDYVSDLICLCYGSPGAYGIVSHPHGTRVGVNIYLDGYIPDENMRFRDTAISFKGQAGEDEEFAGSETLVEYGDLKKEFEDFTLEVKGGRVTKGQIIRGRFRQRPSLVSISKWPINHNTLKQTTPEASGCTFVRLEAQRWIVRTSIAQ